jgi:hypothetical protein
MEEDELKLQNQKGFVKFERWVRRNVGDCPSGHTLDYYNLVVGLQLVYDYVGDEPLFERVQKVKRWRNSIYELFTEYENKDDFREWITQNEHCLDDYFINEERYRKLKGILDE